VYPADTKYLVPVWFLSYANGQIALYKFILHYIIHYRDIHTDNNYLTPVVLAEEAK